MSDRAEQTAAAWALRHPLDPGRQHELEAWLASDPRHAGMLLRAMAALSALDTALAPAPDDIADAFEARPARRRMLIGIGGAIAAAAVGLIGWSSVTSEHVATGRGEIRRLPLVDGSVATINTDSDLRVAFVSDSRRVVLGRGQAWFQVAKDRKRPFIVDAGIAQVRAVGTAFSVDRSESGVQVTVTEGVVAVWPSGESGALTILQAGQYASFHAGGVSPEVGTAPVQITRALAWRNGEISLENDTLGHAVEQFNRYNRQQLVVVDPALAHERLIGLFQIDKPEDFAATLAASLGVSVTVSPDEIRIERTKLPTH
ncbi:FecR family protein [Sphingomonas sp. PP-CE-3G-477]|uniref:FecR domain-containing protein n=1 Tax=Sphingomonas sp. PP-CE-3G-477 TaxID=2135660 RepID=UPI000D387326|nr:FecR domain-containing protein [Sphingomonas sp. PP-CE-3G-477]PTQ64585.1 FecR family protein [Sphingomonas sp. PP-CE-3G-477]